MNIEFAKIFFNISNLLFIVGSASLIRDFYKNPIKYKIPSVLMTFIAMLSIQTAYFFLEDAISICLAIPTVVYWGMASAFSVYKNFKESKSKNVVCTQT